MSAPQTVFSEIVNSKVFTSSHPTQQLAKPKSEQRIPSFDKSAYPGTPNIFSEKMINEYPSNDKKTPLIVNSNVSALNYKTRSCRHFESGKCKLSGLCNFAHGIEELNFYQRVAKIDEKSLKTIDTLSSNKFETSIQKIEKMENQLENFFSSQKQMLEKLKLLSVNIKCGSLKSEESISQMETTIITVYNSAVNYAHNIGKTMDIFNNQNKPSPSDVFPLKVENKKKDEFEEMGKKTDIHELLENSDDNQFEVIKKQIGFIISRLERINIQPESQAFAILKKAENAYYNNKLLESSRYLQQILYDPNADQESVMVYRKIIEQAKSIKF